LQLELWRSGQYLPQTEVADSENLVEKAIEISASSSLQLKDLPGSDHWAVIEHSVAQMLPVQGKMPSVTVWVEALANTELVVELRKSSKAFNHTPDVTLETKSFELNFGKHEIQLDWSAVFEDAGYAFVSFIKNPNIKIQYSEKRVTGLLTVFNATNPAVSNYGKQEPTEDIGVDTFEFWCPQRRPEGRNLAFRLGEPIALFGPNNLKNNHNRPISAPNAWVADFDDPEPVVNIQWKESVTISKIDICFDTDFDHPMENVIYVHPETVMPFCATDIEICNDKGEVVGKISNNHLSTRTIQLDEPVCTQFLKIKVTNPNPHTPASLFQIRCY
jgi:hypothetical protein